MFHPGYRASGRFTIESELFLFPDSSDEGVGIFVGGEALGEQESPSYTALLLRKDGQATVIRRAGGSVKTESDWAAVEGVKPHGKDCWSQGSGLDGTAVVPRVAGTAKVLAT